MATAKKTVIKKASRRRGTVSLTKVRQVVDSVYAEFVASRAAERSAAKKNKKAAANIK